jgi:hypothetical protein
MDTLVAVFAVLAGFALGYGLRARRGRSARRNPGGPD